MLDDKLDRDHDQIMTQLNSIADKPIKYIISTHHHGDHTGGNEKMLLVGVQIISTEQARKKMVDGKMLQTDFHWAQLQLARGLDGVIGEMQ